MIGTKRHFQGPRKLILILLIFILGCSGDRPRGTSSFLSLGTGGTGGIYYPLGGAIAMLLSLEDENRTYTAEVTGGAVENINRIRAGQIDLAFATANTVYDAYFGSPEFNGTVPDLRVVAPLYPNPTHVLVAEGSEAQSIEDFRGLRVSVGAPGSGTEQISKRILEAHGLTYQDVEVRYLTFTESASALKDRAIDAAIISVGYPAASILDATATGGARLLPITPSRITELMELYPYFGPGEIPGGIYPGVDEPLSTAVVLNWIVAPETLPNDIVINLLNLIDNNRQTLERVHPMALQIELAFLEDAPIPIHSGVEQWWSGIR
ncbi:MAG TPA: TAXI family TRAP transporter solute-binding subunit [Gemmatimonadetes bacterium]|jgi:TRAP transporter TAXI family solute receptor|nr:TAXI family TRAP transporter solute-binding subunit [Gemmatimonadota bacterium]